ncbi:MAG TPA: decaprenyl-phosphate phosphoribosyltransferase [Patescibacteria group bacterium]|nr:decaprenyl-phosphate phosphoribosyltransferase [Patescibacteria group bacterium]
MIKLSFEVLRLIRPKQWIKNFAVFAAILFSGQLFDLLILEKVVIAFFVFCGLSSATYILNDIFDIKKDRMHPFKKFRPLAKGAVPIPLAIIIGAILVTVSLITAFYVTPAFFITCVVYLVIQFIYSLFLKSIAVMDILAIASGYILRVYAGEFASGYHISVWLLLTTISISLFLAIGKRRSELTLLTSNKKANIAETRLTLSHYSERLLDVYASIFATSTFISYSLFTFLENPRGLKISLGLLMPDFLPAFFQRKWLMITILPVVYGLMRYLQDIYEKNEGESPDRVLLSDKPLLATVLIWALLVIFIIYFIGPY